MATDITITLDNRPGTLAELGEALGGAGINIQGGCGVAGEGSSSLHILVDDASAARAALSAAGIPAGDERDVLEIAIDDRPGALGAVARQLADAGVNIDLAYLSASGRLILGADDLEKARAAIG
jgi:hypothetical protein